MLPDVINGQAHCLYLDMPKNVLISSREFCRHTLLIAQLKLHRIRGVCTFYVGVLV